MTVARCTVRQQSKPHDDSDVRDDRRTDGRARFTFRFRPSRVRCAAMASDFHRPTRRPPGTFEGFLGGEDPAQVSRVAHDTAAAIISRVRDDPDPVVVARLVSYTDEHGIDAIAELWSHASP